MLKIKVIGFFLLIVAVFGCKTANIPAPYNYKLNELQTNPFGCWMEVSVKTLSAAPDTLNFLGELLNLSKDSTYLLTADGVVSRIENKSIVSANLYTHKNQGNTYLLTTGLLLVPNIIGALVNPEYAGDFLLMGVPTLISGFFQTRIESSKKRNVLVYPKKNSLLDFGKFARYPGGIPETIELRLLYLKKM